MNTRNVVNDRPLVTIVSGYYNRAENVDRSMNSLINQTYKNLQIIVFDDASTDDTYERLARFERIDPRVTIIRHTVNVGFTKGLINAINQSSGDFIAIHGSGDISHADRIEKQVSCFLKSSSVAIVGCNVRRETVDGDLVEEVVNAKRKRGYPFLQAETMLRRSHLEIVGGYRDFFVYGQGADMWQRLLLHFDYRIVDEYLYTHVLVENTLSFNRQSLIERELMARYRVPLIKERRRTGEDSIDKFGNLFYLHQPTSLAFEWGYFKSFVRARNQAPDISRRLFARILSFPASLLILPLYIIALLVPRKLLRRLGKETNIEYR